MRKNKFITIMDKYGLKTKDAALFLKYQPKTIRCIRCGSSYISIQTEIIFEILDLLPIEQAKKIIQDIIKKRLQ